MVEGTTTFITPAVKANYTSEEDSFAVVKGLTTTLITRAATENSIGEQGSYAAVKGLTTTKCIVAVEGDSDLDAVDHAEVPELTTAVSTLVIMRFPILYIIEDPHADRTNVCYLEQHQNSGREDA